MPELGQTNKYLPNEAEIVSQAKTDERAFTVLYDFYFPKIYQFVGHRVATREITEDIVSQIFLDAFSHLKSYQTRGCPFGAWLYRIATNKLTDHYRHLGKNKSVSLTGEDQKEWEIKDEKQNLAEKTEINWQAENVQRALTKLPTRYQKIIELKFFAELNNQEIGLALDLTPNTVGVVLYRALKKFKLVYISTPH
jgi:RNA polymerase sigma-70 factor, ECF subfamily